MKYNPKFQEDDLSELVEQKVLEFLGDPDSGLELRDDFKQELNRRLKTQHKKPFSQQAERKVG